MGTRTFQWKIRYLFTLKQNAVGTAQVSNADSVVRAALDHRMGRAEGAVIDLDIVVVPTADGQTISHRKMANRCAVKTADNIGHGYGLPAGFLGNRLPV